MKNSVIYLLHHLKNTIKWFNARLDRKNELLNALPTLFRIVETLERGLKLKWF